MQFKVLHIFLLTIICLFCNQFGFSQETDSLSFTTQNFSIDTINNSKTDSIIVSKITTKADTVDHQVKYQASDSMIMNLAEKKVYLYNNAEIYYKDIVLTAGYIEMDFGNNEVYATGIADSSGNITNYPIFKDKDEEFASKWMRYNFKTKKGIISEVTTEQSGGFLHGERVKRMADGNICLRNGYYTTCNHEHPHFYINLTKAKVIPDDKIVSGPAYVVLEGLPLPIGIPFGFFPNKRGHTSGIIIPEYGQEQNRGFFLRNGGYYFAVSDYFDLTLNGDIYSRGSWGSTVYSNYKKRYKFQGNMNFSYSKIIIGEKDFANYQNMNTYWLRWNHSQDNKAHPNRNFSANVNFGSSSYNKFNSYTTNNRLRSEVQSNISFNQRWPNNPFSVSANARHSQNLLDSTVSISLPELNLSMSRQYPFKNNKRVGSQRFYEKIGVSLNSNMKNSINIKEELLFTNEAVRNFRNGVKHTVPVSTSMTVFKFFTLNPSLSYTERWYDKSIEKSLVPAQQFNDTTIAPHIKTDTLHGFKRASDYMVTIPLTTKLYGFYMAKSPTAKIVAMRHMMTPSVSYSYRPDFSEEKWGYYKTVSDTNGNIQQYSIFEGGRGHWSGIYGSPPQGKQGSINFNLGNNLELKTRNKNDTINPTKKLSILESLNFGSSYNMALDSLNWSNINIQARTNLFKIININFSSSLDPYAFDSLGRKINVYMWDKHKQIARLNNASFSLGTSFNSDSFKSTKNKEDNNETEAARQAALANGFNDNYLAEYVDFNIPWNLMIDYRISYNQGRFDINKKEFEFNTSQTINFSGDVNLTPKWKISVTSGYDIDKKDFTYTSINIYRDLHCWEMRISLIPMGFYKSYHFTINVKASVLQDLKLNRRRNWTDNF